MSNHQNYGYIIIIVYKLTDDKVDLNLDREREHLIVFVS
jgi:hypothetical protein